MSLPSSTQRAQVSAWFSTLQSTICDTLEGLEAAYTLRQGPGSTGAVFRKKNWIREGGGGGTMAFLGGSLFEKAGVNVSTVEGEFSEDIRSHIPGAEENPHFWASGLSLVIHPRPPHVPIIHMNVRHIITTVAWFGGGIDLTPVIADPEDTDFFHKSLQQTCDAFDPTYYPHFKTWADTYFYLPHRQEARGVGGIFFDYLSTDWSANWAFTQAVGNAFAPLYQEIVQRHWEKPWGDNEREKQLKKRGRYVEFNLLYDRGTQFGLKTGGHTEAILMSLPPQVAWPLPL